MEWLINILIIVIALMHLFYLYFEVFAWDTIGRKIFRGYPREFFQKTKVLAANQGTYNGFLAAGLIWAVLIKNEIWANNIALFFLSCVVIAGMVGAVTADKKIFFVQGIPALIAIILILFS